MHDLQLPIIKQEYIIFKTYYFTFVFKHDTVDKAYIH